MQRQNSGTFSVLDATLPLTEGTKTWALLQISPTRLPLSLKSPPPDDPFQHDEDAMRTQGIFGELSKGW